MRKVIFLLLFLGFLTYSHAAKIGTGLEWEAHDIRVIVYDSSKDQVLTLDSHRFYDALLFEAEWVRKEADSDFIHEGDFIKVVIDNLWDDFGGFHGCTEMVSIGVGAVSKENLICRSRALAILYNVMKNASTMGARVVDLHEKMAKKYLADYKLTKCVEASQIVTLYNDAIKADKFLKETHTTDNVPRWQRWDIRQSNEWKRYLGKLDDDNVKLYICGEAGSAMSSVVYHMNFGIPLNELFDNGIFLDLSQGHDTSKYSKDEWTSARARTDTCSKCLKPKYGERNESSPSPDFWAGFNGLLTYLYYGWFNDENLTKRNNYKGKDSHAILIKSMLDSVLQGLRDKFPAVNYTDILRIGADENMDICYSECTGFTGNPKKTKIIDRKWSCNLFWKEMDDTYSDAKKFCGKEKNWKWPWSGSSTGKDIPAYWQTIEAGTYKDEASKEVEWEERDALIIIGESRISDEAGDTIREMYEPTTNPDTAEKNIKDGIITLLKLHLGAKDK